MTAIPSPPWRAVISILVTLHLLAVIAEPMQFFSRSSRGTSPLSDPLRSTLAPYVEFAYLNHGYFFFAPEPGPSHLIDCQLEFGSERGSLRFPDRQAQWPRLLYHRHFMLAEFLNQLHAPPVEPELAADDPLLLAEWRADRARFEMVRNSMEQHLRVRYGADSARIERIEHRLPSSLEVLVDRIPLDDPNLYIVLPDAPPLLPNAGAGDGFPVPLNGRLETPLSVGPSDTAEKVPQSPGTDTTIRDGAQP